MSQTCINMIQKVHKQKHKVKNEDHNIETKNHNAYNFKFFLITYFKLKTLEM